MSRIILCGHAGSGKDHARKKFEERGFIYAVTYTTRPKRAGEEGGKDYIFVTEEIFDELVKTDQFYEWVEFNSWKYGTTKFQFREFDLFIMTPSGISKLSDKDRKESIIIFFDIPESIRMERLRKRSDADTVDRRIESDRIDFQDFTDFDIRITNENF